MDGKKSTMNDESKQQQVLVLLRNWLCRQSDRNHTLWFEQQVSLLRTKPNAQAFNTGFSLISRRFGKEILNLSAQDLLSAEACIAGWQPNTWSLVDLARILLLVELPYQALEFAARFSVLLQTADVSEAISLYRGLPVYPEPEALEPIVGEGLRTNIRPVFEAIIHHNPYPFGYFETQRWNNMILKALFIECPIAPVYGLDQRLNQDLANTLFDFVHERQAAGRQVPIDLWRCVGPFIPNSELPHLRRFLLSENLQERQAVTLALSCS